MSASRYVVSIEREPLGFYFWYARVSDSGVSSGGFRLTRRSAERAAARWLAKNPESRFQDWDDERVVDILAGSGVREPT